MNNNLFPKIFLIESENDELYISDSFFVLYRNNKLFFYKKVEEKINIDDIKLFLKNSIGINDVKVLSFTDAKIKNQNEINHLFFKAIRKPYFFYYALYLVALILIFIFIYFNTSMARQKDDFNILKTNIEKIKENKKFIYVTKRILDIYENTKLNNVTVSSILFENSKMLLKLKAKKKDGIYRLLTKIEKSSIENMQYNEDKKEYEADVSFKISRN